MAAVFLFVPFWENNSFGSAKICIVDTRTHSHSLKKKAGPGNITVQTLRTGQGYQTTSRVQRPTRVRLYQRNPGKQNKSPSTEYQPILKSAWSWRPWHISAERLRLQKCVSLHISADKRNNTVTKNDLPEQSKTHHQCRHPQESKVVIHAILCDGTVVCSLHQNFRDSTPLGGSLVGDCSWLCDSCTT